MLGGTPRELACEFSVSRELRPSVGRAVYHCSLNLAEGEHLSDEQWGELAERYLVAMGFLSKDEQGEPVWTDSQYVVVRHSDTEHEHVHLVASRIRLDGTVVSDSHDYRRSEAAIRQLERAYGLQAVESSDAPAAGSVAQVRITRAEVELARRLGVEVPPKQRLGRLLDCAVERCAGEPEQLEGVLAQLGVEVPRRWTNLRNGRTDATFALAQPVAGMQSSFSGVHIGRDYEWERLAGRVVEWAAAHPGVPGEEQEADGAADWLSAAEARMQEAEAELAVWEQQHPSPEPLRLFAFAQRHRIYYQNLGHLEREVGKLCAEQQSRVQRQHREIADIEATPKPGWLDFSGRKGWQERQETVPQLQRECYQLETELQEYRQMLAAVREYRRRQSEWQEHPEHRALRQRVSQEQQAVCEYREQVQQQWAEVQQRLPQLLEDMAVVAQMLGRQQNGWQLCEGRHYWIAVSGQSYELVAKDMRGKLLEVEDGEVRHCAVELEDMEGLRAAAQYCQQEQEQEQRQRGGWEYSD
jgi:hypothetical protein